MENLKITLPTFLRICASTPLGIVSALKTFTAPGGYDFYKVMKKLVAGIASGEIDLDAAKQEASKIVQKPEREHTLQALESFAKWFSSVDLHWTAPPKGSFKSKSGSLTVRLEPELAFADAGGITSVLYLWNLAKPELSKKLAAEGLQLLMTNIVSGHYEFGMFDLRKSKIHGAEAVDGGTMLRLESDLKLVEQVWMDVNDPSVGTEDTLKHISEFKLPAVGGPS